MTVRDALRICAPNEFGIRHAYAVPRNGEHESPIVRAAAGDAELMGGKIFFRVGPMPADGNPHAISRSNNWGTGTHGVEVRDMWPDLEWYPVAPQSSSVPIERMEDPKFRTRRKPFDYGEDRPRE